MNEGGAPFTKPCRYYILIWLKQPKIIIRTEVMYEKREK